jgi:6-bladed beta-propeller
MKRSCPWPAVVSSVILIAGLCAGATPSGTQDARKEQEVLVVRNPRKPVKVAGRPIRLTLIEELTIGLGSDENGRFTRLQSAQADSGARIYALDGGDRLIKVFDHEGRFIRVIGRPGQGPGEFSAPARIILTPQDEVAAYDAGNRRLAFFKQDGALIKEIPTARWLFMRFRVNSRGEIIADHAVISEEGGVVYQLTKFSPDLTSPVKIATAPSTDDPGSIQPFAPTMHHGLRRDDGLVWGVNSRYELMVTDADGRTRMRVLKVPEPCPLTQADRKALIEKDYRDLPPNVVLDIPSNYPPFWNFIVADTDHIFVRTYVKDGKKGFIHDVFDPEGRFVAQFSLGEEEFAMMARDGKLYTLVRENDEGIPLIKRYRLVWQ